MENSALYGHLREAGYSFEDISPETLASVIDDVKDSMQHDDSVVKNENESESEEEQPTTHRRLKFSCKRFLLNVVWWFFGWNAWISEARAHQQRFAFEVNDDALNTVILEHEDFEFLDKFYPSIKERFKHEDDRIGEYFKHIAIFIVVLGYGIIRCIQMKNSGDAGLKTFAGDVVVVGLMVGVLLPSVVKMVAIERLKKRLHAVKQSIVRHIIEMERLHKLVRRSVRLVQEAEVVARGFTLSSKMAATSRDEGAGDQTSGGQAGVAGDQGTRQCPLLRHAIFHAARGVMLATKKSTQAVLDIYPLQHEFDDSPTFLAPLPLDEYGPCVTTQGDEAALRRASDGYSIAAVKGMVRLCNAHLSEWVRVTAIVCLLKHYNTPKDFSRVFDPQDAFFSECRNHVTRLEYSYLSHRGQLSAGEGEEREREREREPSREGHALYVAVHSLTLHLRAAFNRLQDLECRLEKHQEADAESIGTEDQTLWRDLLKVIKNDLDSCQDCWQESVNRLNKRWSQNAQDSSQTSSASSVKKAASSPEIPDVPVVEITDPIIEDQVFEGYTDPTETAGFGEDSEYLTSAEEKERRKKEREDATRLLRELRSVIAVRALDKQQREARARMRAQGATSGVNSAHAGDNREECQGEMQSQNQEQHSIADEKGDSQRKQEESHSEGHCEQESRQEWAGEGQELHSNVKDSRSLDSSTKYTASTESPEQLTNDRTNSSRNSCRTSKEKHEPQNTTKNACTFIKGKSSRNESHNTTSSSDAHKEEHYETDLVDDLTANTDGVITIDSTSPTESESITEFGPTTGLGLEFSADLKARLTAGTGFTPFTSDVAALAVHRAQQMGALTEDTVGDSGEESECDQ